MSLTDYAMALHAAALVKDGGTLQIGIGSFSDALAHALILRHTRNGEFRALLGRARRAAAAGRRARARSSVGLYGCTEMLVDGFLALMRAGILSRRVEGADGREAVLHAGFFVGNQAFYRELREMPPDELDAIAMTGISFTNTLAGDEAAKRAQRRDARFVNTAMVATLLGAVSSDQLEDGRVVSGAGGQHDLVAMAHALDGARSIIGLRSTRRQDRRTVSNIVWRYANATVPRHAARHRRHRVRHRRSARQVRPRRHRRDAGRCRQRLPARACQGRAKAPASSSAPSTLPSRAAGNRPERIAAALAPARARRDCCRPSLSAPR